VRRGEDDLVDPYRRRALGAGIAAGALALVGLVVLHEDAHALYRELVTGAGLPALIVSLVAGAATITLVLARRFEPARVTAALAVTATVAGWALAQQPRFLPGLTVEQAAAPHDTLVAVIVAVLAGAILLFPALALLLRLTLGGALGHGGDVDREPPDGGAGERRTLVGVAPGLAGRAAAACLVGGLGLLTIAEAGWAHAVGLVLLAGFIVTGFLAAAPALLEAEPSQAAPDQ
jgi:cytochrome d ubiquinol oxidase subunit II